VLFSSCSVSVGAVLLQCIFLCCFLAVYLFSCSVAVGAVFFLQCICWYCFLAVYLLVLLSYSVSVGVFCSTPGVAVARSVPNKVALHMLFTAEPLTAQGISITNCLVSIR